MNRWWRMGAWALGGGLLLLVALVAAVLLLVDPDDFRGPLETAVRERTGRELRMGGSMGLSLVPCCGVTVAEVSLGNPPGFTPEPLLAVAEGRAELRLWPLLTAGRVEIGQVRLRGLALNLQVRADGSNNWSLPAATAGPGGPAGEGTAATPISLAGLRIEDGSIRYQDATDGSDYQVTGLQLASGPVTPGQPVALEGSLDMQLPADRRRARVELRTRLQLPGPQQGLGLAETRGRVELTTPELPAGPLTLELSLAALAPVPDGWQLTGLQGSGAAGPLRFSFKGAGTWGGQPTLAGTLGLEPFSPRELLATLERPAPRTTDPAALSRLAGSAAWSWVKDGISLEQLDLQLDDSRLTGSVSRQQPAAGPALLRFALQVDRLDLDRYLPPASPGAPADKAGAAAPGTQPTALPLELIRGLNLQGEARIGRLQVAGVRLADVQVGARAADRVLRLDPVSATLYGGTLKARTTVDARADTAAVSLEQDFRGVALGELLADYAQVRNISGRMDLSLEGRARGNTDQALVRSLDGRVSLQLQDGQYRGLDVWHAIRSARAVLRRQAPPPKPAEPATPITRLELAGPVGDGVLRSQSFVAEIPYLRISGPLTLDAPARTLDARLEAVVFQQPQFDDGTDWSDFVNARLPLEIRGPLQGPKVSVDLKRLVREGVKQGLRDAILKKLGGQQDPAPADGQPPPKSADPIQKALDRLFR